MRYTEEILLKAATDAYNHGDVQFDIDSKNCALIVIDMQDEFVKPEWTSSWIPEATKQVPKIKKLIEHCRKTDIPVLYTAFRKTHFFKDRPRSGELMPNRYPHIGSDPTWFEEGRIWHEIKPMENEIVISKPSYGAFYDTPLETILKNLKKDTIIICGTLTNYCCGMTARQGYERGFKVIFGSDVTSTDNPEMQEPELQVLRKGYAKVMDLEGILKVLK
ncbi:cysteine hydrolase family protein [Galbibacter pacificus]|uniref:Cysteine hydrolase n=1 Tax=Galbibacter pacificus TaxID=2996052 RepID=A0ABT6FN25_9FLAO|nr:isochorismatase family cysteine hydrolase [Galbibacter pacificus]MDG3581194.1 cysteine hydrolase [Galbibacter pacificus]MDG3584672.1 cysteine hydrolase [Galbibacter pacificus]